jgi:NTE family protein
MDATGARALHPLTGGQGPDRGVQRLARRLAGRSTGVVLSSGGARGFAHIGVLEELTTAGVEIDRVGGSSMGAFVGAMFAMGMSPAEIAARCREELIARRPLGDYALPITSLVRGGRALAMLARTFGREPEIEELAREFFCVSSDLVTGEQVVHRSGPVAEAVAASMCLPGIFPPIPRAGGLLVDGGVLDSLPVGPMAATMEGPIIAVDVGRRFTHARAPASRGARIAARWAAARAGADASAAQGHLPTIKETLARSMVLGSIESAKAARKRADVIVEPDTGACEMLDFRRLDEMIEAGRQAARQALSDAPALNALNGGAGSPHCT